MLLIASVFALLVGISLGVMGGGGSILTVPILRYVLAMEAHQAIAVSMLVVGTTSVAALIPHARRKRVRWRVGATFGFAGMVGAFFAGRVTHYIPGIVLLTGFAVMMLATAVAMLRRPKGPPREVSTEDPVSLPKLVAEGLLVGAVTGLLGAGGGFVIVPALVLRVKLPMNIAVGTSLVIIAMNTAAGFIGLAGQVRVDGQIALIMSSAAVVGSIAGSALAGRISPAALRTGFGWFVVAMAFFILAQELPALLGRSPSIRVALAISLIGTISSIALARAVVKRSPCAGASNRVAAAFAANRESNGLRSEVK